jgi:Flp pilus assembly protein TadB
MANGNGNGSVLVEVLAERIANVSKKLDEQVAISKTSVDAALTAISVAKVDQERTVSVAFNASQLAISKTEVAQQESNRAIAALTNDVTRLKENQAQSSGSGKGMRDMYGWAFGAAMLLVAIASLFFKFAR